MHDATTSSAPPRGISSSSHSHNHHDHPLRDRDIASLNSARRSFVCLSVCLFVPLVSAIHAEFPEAVDLLYEGVGDECGVDDDERDAD